MSYGCVRLFFLKLNICAVTNVLAAVRLGWGHCVLFSEKSTSADINADVNNQGDRSYTVISSLEQLREIWPEIFNERAALSTTTH